MRRKQTFHHYFTKKSGEVYNMTFYSYFSLFFVAICVGFALSQEECVKNVRGLVITGVPPLSRTPVSNPLACRDRCLHRKPRCKAAVFYYVSDDNMICQLYAENSETSNRVRLDQEVDTQLYEVLSNCIEDADLQVN